MQSLFLAAIRRRIVGPPPNQVAKADIPGITKVQRGGPKNGNAKSGPHLHQETWPRGDFLGGNIDGSVTVYGNMEGYNLDRQIPKTNIAHKTMKYFRSFGVLIPNVGADKCKIEIPSVATKPNKSVRRNRAG